MRTRKQPRRKAWLRATPLAVRARKRLRLLLRANPPCRVRSCSPSRSQVYTGRYPYHNGFWHSNCPTAQLKGVPLQFLTLAQELQAAGYSTHAIGKWHQGQASDAYTPTRRGFATFLGYYQEMEDHWSHGIHTGHTSGPFGVDVHNDTQGEPLSLPGLCQKMT